MVGSAVGWSKYTVKKYVKQAEKNPLLLTPGKTRSRKKIKQDVDEVTKGEIKQIIYEFAESR